MVFQRQLTFWIAALVLVSAILWLLGQVLLPFVAGLALAYLLNPLTNRLERLGISRLVAALAVISLMVLVFVLLVLIMAPILGSQLAAFIENIPGYVRRVQTVVTDPSRPWVSRIFGEGFVGADKSVGDLLSQGAGWMTTFLRSLWSGGQALVSIFSLVVVTPVVAFYLICDWPRMFATVDSWVPVPQRETVRQLAREIDAAIAGFVRGQTGVCLVLGSFYAVALSFTGLNFGLLIGLISGLISFIPYVGSMTGLVLAVGVAIAQFWPDWTMIAVVIGIFLFGQFIEGNVLAPKLVGDSVGLHPVWLMFALFAFGYLFGFVGLLLAVPLAAAIGVLMRFALQRYLASPLYTGEQGGLTAMTASGPRQLALALPHAESFAPEDFVGGPGNAAALALVERWPDWPSRTMVLAGPEGSGKSHLASVWANESGARFMAARALEHANLPMALATGALVLEDVAPQDLDERMLFHLLNLAREEEAYLLLTARSAPAGWSIGLRDLASRMRALPVVSLEAPDDALLRAVLLKLFADRQMLVDDSLVAYLIARIERSFAAAREIVTRLDAEALRLRRPVTRALAAELLRDDGAFG